HLSAGVHRAAVVEDPDALAVGDAPGGRIAGADPESRLRVGPGESGQRLPVVVERVKVRQRARLTEQERIAAGALGPARRVLLDRLVHGSRGSPSSTAR